MALQSITIADRHYERTRDEVDFIKRYIFPGACIPSVSALAAAMAASSDLRIVSLEDIGPHYATTLAAWRRNFMGNLPRSSRRWAIRMTSSACGSSISATARRASPSVSWGTCR